MKRSVSNKRAKAISTALFLVGLAIVSYTQVWWPGIMLAVGLPMALRQFLLGRYYDMWVSLVVFGGVFVTVQYNISFKIFLPILFALGGIYILFREFTGADGETVEEEEEDLNQEIEEDQHS